MLMFASPLPSDFRLNPATSADIHTARMDSCSENSPDGPIRSRFRGLSWDKKHQGWRVRIYWAGKQRHVGRYEDDVVAARAYDKSALYLYGANAITNFGLEACMADPTEVSPFIVLAKEQAGQDHITKQQRFHSAMLVSDAAMLQAQQRLSGSAVPGQVVTQQQQQVYTLQQQRLPMFTDAVAWQQQQNQQQLINHMTGTGHQPALLAPSTEVDTSYMMAGASSVSSSAAAGNAIIGNTGGSYLLYTTPTGQQLLLPVPVSMNNASAMGCDVSAEGASLLLQQQQAQQQQLQLHELAMSLPMTFSASGSSCNAPLAPAPAAMATATSLGCNLSCSSAGSAAPACGAPHMFPEGIQGFGLSPAAAANRGMSPVTMQHATSVPGHVLNGLPPTDISRSNCTPLVDASSVLMQSIAVDQKCNGYTNICSNMAALGLSVALPVAGSPTFSNSSSNVSSGGYVDTRQVLY